MPGSNANGTLGSWSAQTTLVTAVDVAATVVYNGWIYVIGGCTNGGGWFNANVQSAQINATTGATRCARARTSNSSASAARAMLSCAGSIRQQIVDLVDLRSARAARVSSNAEAIAEEDDRPVRQIRVRRLHAVLFAVPFGDRADPDRAADHPAGVRLPAADAWAARSHEFEPTPRTSLQELLPRNLAVQVFRALLENSASFYGAQMSAMDNATRNAGEMIRRQTLLYNRTRQAMITKELIEIISGAEALCKPYQFSRL